MTKSGFVRLNSCGLPLMSTFSQDVSLAGKVGWYAITVTKKPGQCNTYTIESAGSQAGLGLYATLPNGINVGTASTSRIVVNADDIDLATTGVTPGTYTRVIVDAWGRVTFGDDHPTALTLGDLTDVNLTSPQAGDFLEFDGTEWVNSTPTITAWSLSGNTLTGTEILGSTSNHDLVFVTNNTEKMRLTATDGYFGLGTSSPSYQIHVANSDEAHVTTHLDNTFATGSTSAGYEAIVSSGARFFLKTYAGPWNGWNFQNQTILASNYGLVLMTDADVDTGGTNHIEFRVGGYDTPTERMRILPNGRVLIGTTTDAGTNLLQVNGSVYNKGVTIDIASKGASKLLESDANGTGTWVDGSSSSFYTFSTGLTKTGSTITANISTGIAGGQTIYGGTGSGENLTIYSTSHATKGKIFFGANSAYDGANNRLGIGTASPSTEVEVVGTTKSSKFLTGTPALTVTYNGYLQETLTTSNVAHRSLVVEPNYNLVGVSTTNLQSAIYAGIRIAATHTGSFSSSNGVSSVQANLFINTGATGTITKGIGYRNVVASPPSGFTITDYHGYIDEGSSTQYTNITNRSGITLDSMTSAGNLTYLLMGTETIPTGSYGIYSTVTYDNYLAGRLGVGVTPSFLTHIERDTDGIERLYVKNPSNGGSAASWIQVSCGTSATPAAAFLEASLTAFDRVGLWAINKKLVIGTDFQVTSGGTSPIQFWTGGSNSTNERMRIQSNGRVLIGTTTDAGELLQVAGTVRIVNTTGTSSVWASSGLLTMTKPTGGEFVRYKVTAASGGAVSSIAFENGSGHVTRICQTDNTQDFIVRFGTTNMIYMNDIGVAFGSFGGSGTAQDHLKVTGGTVNASGTSNCGRFIFSGSSNTTGGYNVLSLELTDGSTGSGSKNLIRASLGGTNQFVVDKDGKITLSTGSNKSTGSATLVAGTVTVNNTLVTANSKIFFSVTTAGGTRGFWSYTKVAATSFTVTSDSATETSTFDWWIIN